MDQWLHKKQLEDTIKERVDKELKESSLDLELARGAFERLGKVINHLDFINGVHANQLGQSNLNPDAYQDCLKGSIYKGD